jgi:hypothetical protein
MQAYRVKATIQGDGELMVSNLPLQAGEAVELIILVQPSVCSVRTATHCAARPLPISIGLNQLPGRTGKLPDDCVGHPYLDVVGA